MQSASDEHSNSIIVVVVDVGIVDVVETVEVVVGS